MTVPSFVDTNILVYAEDVDAGAKHQRAGELIHELWEKREGVVSIQVLQEFFVTVTRKIPKRLGHEDAELIVEEYLTWHVVPNTGDLLRMAMTFAERFKISFWDASIIAAAKTANCNLLYSEDLNHDQLFDSVRVVNPFR